MHQFIKRLVLILLSLFLFSTAALGQDVRHEIHFPDLPGYVTLKCDLHNHTVFSDGEVWPTVRVVEAWRQGLDAIAITDHVEYAPHRDDVPVKHNRPYELAVETAAERNLLLIRGAEITRNTPPGHFNAVFTRDNAELETPDLLEAVKRAAGQGAFIFWNHQGWKGSARGQWLDVHTAMYENRWLRGMEVCNGDEYYPEAHQWCLDRNLTMLGNSDIHAPDPRRKSDFADHRTMTLVFAKERTLPVIQDALLAGRTAVWFKENIIGRKEILDPFFGLCVQIDPNPAWTEKVAWLQIRNRSEADVLLRRRIGPGPAAI